MELLNDNAKIAKKILDNIANSFNLAKDGQLSDFKFEFLDICFKELLGSKYFAEQNEERRKRFFDDYQLIEIVLNQVNEYVYNFPKDELGEFMMLEHIFTNAGNDFEQNQIFKAN